MDLTRQSLLSQCSTSIGERLGLHFPADRLADLERGLLSLSQAMDFPTIEDCLRWLLASPLTPQQEELLATHLTIGETYFFRDTEFYAHLENALLPELLRDRAAESRPVQIWSAACASGEEPYSLAMLLRRRLAVAESARFNILATDINPTVLTKAQAGIYGKWSFRNAPEWAVSRCFESRPQGRMEILPAIRKHVGFSRLNLVSDAFPPLPNGVREMDLILCRNVLIYFSQEVIAQVVAKLHASLAVGGWLAVSPSEASHRMFTQFSQHTFGNVILYRKEATAPAPWQPPRAPMAPVAGVPPKLKPAPAKRTPARSVPTKAPAEEPRLTQAQRLFDAGNYEALGALMAAPEAKAGAEENMLWARALANQGRTDSALEKLEAVIRADKLCGRAYYLRGILLADLKQPAEAVRAIRQALYIDPEFVMAHVALGNHAARAGETAAGAKHVQTALTLLQKLPPAAMIPESDGLTAARLIEVLNLTKRIR